MTRSSAATSRLSVLQASTVAGLEVLHRAGAGPTVVALPGLGSSAWAWESLAEAAPDLNLYAISLAGRGGSHAAQGAKGLEGHARMVAAVVEELGLEDVVVVGHSMGAYLAPLVAQQLNGRVKHLVLVDGGIRPAFPFFMSAGLTRMVFRSQLKKARGPFPTIEAVLKKARVGPMLADRPELTPQIIRMLDRELGGTPGARTALTDVERCADDAADTFFGPSFEPALAALTVPAYVILAENAKKAGQKPFISDARVKTAVAQQPLLAKVTRLTGNHITVVFEPEVIEAIRA